MYRYTICFALFFSAINFLSSQCPDLAANASSTSCTGTDCAVCGSDNVIFAVDDPNLPPGSIDWYSSSTSGFDPLTQGTLEGSSVISAAQPCDDCPTIECIYIDACGPGSQENWNEFAVIASGSGFEVNDLTFMFDDANSSSGGTNSNINVGGLCNWFEGDISLFSGCADLVAVGPGDFIPRNSTVVIQTSRLGNQIYDLSGMCGTSDCIYVLSNSCDRVIGAFSNCTSSGSRDNSISLGCGCSDMLTYDTQAPDYVAFCDAGNGSGTHVFPGGIYENNGCNVGPNISSIPQNTQNSVTGNYVFTPSDAQCNTTQYFVGVFNPQYGLDDACCGDQITDEYALTISCAEAELSGGGDLCPGDCVEVDVLFTGGESPYDLNLTFDFPFPIPDITIPLPGFPVAEKITICFDTGGPIVDAGNFTVNVPAIAGGFGGSLFLDSFTDANGCAGDITGGAVSISFNNAPDVTTPTDPVEACDLGDGTGLFILSDVSNIINGGSGATVNYYLDDMGMISITDPYQSSSTTIYAAVDGDPCDSELVTVELEVIENGDAGFISFFCDESGATDCTICDDDITPGEEITLTILFEDQTANYDYTVTWTTDMGTSSTIDGTAMGTATFNFNIFTTTTFEITSVTLDGDCPDETMLGDIVTVNYGMLPQIDNPMDIEGCGMVTLPAITGPLVPSDAAYYDQPNGMGNMYAVGTEITTSGTYYIYAGIEDCDVDLEFDINILDAATIDEPMDIITCGTYALPPITGTNVENAQYFTEIDGGGSVLPEGFLVTASITLYLYDPLCMSNQPDLEITITPGPVIQNNTDTLICEMYIIEPIIGEDLSGNQGYFSMSGGQGISIAVGDTITTDSTIYIFDDTGGCSVQVPVIITVQEVMNPGLDSTIVICEGDNNLYNINYLLAGDSIDLGGAWTEMDGTTLLGDSSAVDFSSLSNGTYQFEYQILDSICVDTSAVLTVNILGSVNAGIDGQLSLCKDTIVNLYEVLGNPSEGGLFELVSGDAIIITDPGSVEIIVDNTSTTVYNYIVGDANSSCGADTSVLTIEFLESSVAGDDNSVGLCAGADIDLTSIINGNNAPGLFTEESPSGGLSGSVFSSGGLADDTYTVWYVVNNNIQCPADTAILTITVSAGADAGPDSQMTICDQASIELTDIITGDSGGEFYDGDDLISNTSIDLSNISGNQTYSYIVGDGISCPFDTATISLDLVGPVDVSLELTDDNVCDDGCGEIVLTASYGGTETIDAYITIEGTDGFMRFINPSILSSVGSYTSSPCIGTDVSGSDFMIAGNIYTYTIDSVVIGNCAYPIGTSVDIIATESAQSSLTGVFCTDAEIVVGSDTYDINNPSGTTTIIGGSVSGCDSLIVVDLQFQDVAEGEYIDEVCNGEEVIIDGTVYNESNIPESILIPMGSVNGCDSLLMIDVTFLPPLIGMISTTACEGDTIFIGDTPVFEAMIANEITIPSASGCDSVVTVTLSLTEPVLGMISGSFCENYEIEVNGILYNIDNPSGTELLVKAASTGCDSLVDIDLSFDMLAVDSTITFATCDENEFLLIGGTVFNVTNPSGQVTLFAATSEDCDTVVNVEITFGSLEIEYTEVDGTCMVADSGAVTIESIAGVAPFNILYNGNNTLAFVLPVDIPLPVGTGEMIIMDASGCETTIDYTLMEGEEGGFDSFENNGQVSISGGDIDSISWSPVDGLSCVDCVDPFAMPEVTTTYIATIFYGGECIEMDTLTVEVIDDTPDYIVPNIFSPNDDNQNSIFNVTVTDGATGIPVSMNIYDRWGNKVYTATEADLSTGNGWNGTKNNSRLETGVFVYHIQIREEDGQLVNLYGDVTLLR